MRPKTYSKNKIPIFISKLYKILQGQQNKQVIDWTPQGNSFIILNVKNFTQTILPQFYKHSNYNSFIRQLNMYSFTKIRRDGREGYADNIYQNPFFLRDDPSRLIDIRRKQIVPKNQQLFLSIQKLNQDKENQSLQEKLKTIRNKQQKLTQVCYSLINQNKILVAQNQDLVKRIQKEAKKKDRILNQIFRIIGSISEQMEEFVGDNNIFFEQLENEKRMYIDMLMNFIDQNNMPTILKTLKKFLNIGEIKKSKNFTIIPSQKKEEEVILKNLPNTDNLQNLLNFQDSFMDEDIDRFLNEACLILDNSEL